jgi:hypothetical protein
MTALPFRPGSPSDPEKVGRDQARAAHERAVDIGDAEKLTRIAGLHRAAVQNAHPAPLPLP